MGKSTIVLIGALVGAVLMLATSVRCLHNNVNALQTQFASQDVFQDQAYESVSYLQDQIDELNKDVRSINVWASDLDDRVRNIEESIVYIQNELLILSTRIEWTKEDVEWNFNNLLDLIANLKDLANLFGYKMVYHPEEQRWEPITKEEN